MRIKGNGGLQLALAVNSRSLRSPCSIGRPCWARTSDQRIMRTTSAFAARFRFVVWTLSCLSAFPSSLYTFSIRSFARRWHGGCSAVAFTEFEKFYARTE